MSSSPGDLVPEAKTAVEKELRARAEAPLSECVIDRRLPYRWGKFQGWVLLVVGCFAVLLLIALVLGLPLDERSKDYAIVSPLMVASGYAFVRRSKYAAVMPYLWIGFYVLDFLLALLVGFNDGSLTAEQKGEAIGRGLGEMVVGGIFWGFCAFYYHKRRPEFIAEGRVKSPRRPQIADRQS